MRLEHLFRVRLTYSQGWAVDLDGGGQQHLYLADGECEGTVNGRFRGANFPLRRTPEGPFCPDMRAVIETDDGASMSRVCSRSSSPVAASMMRISRSWARAMTRVPVWVRPLPMDQPSSTSGRPSSRLASLMPLDMAPSA